MKREISHRVHLIAGILWIILGISGVITILGSPLGIVAIVIGYGQLKIAKEKRDRDRYIKRKLSKLSVPTATEEEPIITPPPKDRKLIK